MERIIISLDETKLINELLKNELVKDVGEITNKEWKENNRNSKDIDIAITARMHHPDYQIIGDKTKIKLIATKYKYNLVIQDMETFAIHIL